MIRMKRGVVLMSREPYIFEMIAAADDAFDFVSADTIITSGVEGTHSQNSLHYKGRALDFRIRHISRSAAETVFRMMRSALGDDYDVVLEDTHIHVEFDPK